MRAINEFLDSSFRELMPVLEQVRSFAEMPKTFFSQLEAHFETLYPKVPNQVQLVQKALGQHDFQVLTPPSRQVTGPDEEKSQDRENPEVATFQPEVLSPNFREIHRTIGLLGLKLTATAAAVALLATFSLSATAITWGMGLGLTSVAIIRTGNESVQQTIDSMKDFGEAAAALTFQAALVGVAAGAFFFSCKVFLMTIGALIHGSINGVAIAASLLASVSMVALTALRTVAFAIGYVIKEVVTGGLQGLKSLVSTTAPYAATAGRAGLSGLKQGGIAFSKQVVTVYNWGYPHVVSGANAAMAKVAPYLVLPRFLRG